MDSPIVNAEDIFKKTIVKLRGISGKITTDDFCREFKRTAQQVSTEKREKLRKKKEKQEKREKKTKELKKKLEDWFGIWIAKLNSLTFSKAVVIGLMIGILVGIILFYFCSPITLLLLGLQICISVLLSSTSVSSNPL